MFQDSHGNVVPVSSEAQPAVELQVLEAGPGGGGPVMQELLATADLVSCAACIRARMCVTPEGGLVPGTMLLGLCM